MIIFELVAIKKKDLVQMSINHLNLTADFISEKCIWYSNRLPYKTFLNCKAKPFNFLISEKNLIEGLVDKGVLEGDHFLIFFDSEVLETCLTDAKTRMYEN